jgi:hypothetical protein
MDLIAKAVTLKSIRLADPTAQEIVFSAKHSILYTFTSGQWVSRLNVLLEEASLSEHGTLEKDSV